MTKAELFAKQIFTPFNLKFLFPYSILHHKKSWISQSDYAKCLLQVTKQPEELSGLCYRKGWHGFPVGSGAGLVPCPTAWFPAPRPGRTQPDSSTAPSAGCSVTAAAAPLPRPWARRSAGLVAAGPGSRCPRSRPVREMPEQSSCRLPCSPVLAGHRQPAASQPEPAAGQGRARCKAQRPHRTELAVSQPRARQATG